MGLNLDTSRTKQHSESDIIRVSNGNDLGIDYSVFSEEFIDYLFDSEGDDNELELEAESIREGGKMEVNRITEIICSFIDGVLVSPYGYRKYIDIQLVFDRMLNLLNILCNPGEGRPGVSRKVYDRYVELLSRLSEN